MAEAVASAPAIQKFLDQHRRKPVSVSAFTQRMTGHWSRLGNVPNVALIRAWSNLSATFNAAMVGALGDRWHVRQEATGCGKSESLALWASMLPRHTTHPFSPHHGLLIVVRTIQQTETMVQTINAHAGEVVARAHHSGNTEYPPSRLSPQEMLDAPVLVVCHAAYERGADDPESRSGSLFRAFHVWPSSPTGYRRGVVIDEAIDFISFTQVTLDDVDLLLRIVDLPGTDHREQVQALRQLREFLFAEAEMEMELRKEEQKPSVLLSNEDGTYTSHPYQRFSLLWGTNGLVTPAEIPVATDLTPLRETIKTAPIDFKVLRRKDPVEKSILQERLLDILSSAQRTLQNWAFYSREDGREEIGPALYTASVLPGLREIPEGQRPGVVVLDATASQSPVYTLFGAVVHPTSTTIRTYRNAALHVAFLPAAGKRHLTNHAKEEVPKLITNLRTMLEPTRKLFVLTFKGVAHHLLGFKNVFPSLMVEHYGNVNGRNDFSSCDAGCLFGVFRYPKAWSTAIYFALKGEQGWRWFYSDDGKKIRREIELGQVAAETIQGLNRTSTRNCINNLGDCPTTDLFLTLTDNPQGRAVLQRIRAAMPGINVKQWRYSLATVTYLRRTNHDEILVAYAQTMAVGKHRASEVRQALGIGLKAWERLVEKIKAPDAPLAQALLEAGVTYSSDPRRPRLGAFFIKSDNQGSPRCAGKE
jgi:hypothetical protein